MIPQWKQLYKINIFWQVWFLLSLIQQRQKAVHGRSKPTTNNNHNNWLYHDTAVDNRHSRHYSSSSFPFFPFSSFPLFPSASVLFSDFSSLPLFFLPFVPLFLCASCFLVLPLSSLSIIMFLFSSSPPFLSSSLSPLVFSLLPLFLSVSLPLLFVSSFPLLSSLFFLSLFLGHNSLTTAAKTHLRRLFNVNIWWCNKGTWGLGVGQRGHDLTNRDKWRHDYATLPGFTSGDGLGVWDGETDMGFTSMREVPWVP